QDYTESFKWMVAAGQQHIPEAQCEVGRQLQLGLGVGRNEELAEQWYRAAVDKGYSAAEYNLGHLSAEKGHYVDAVQWFSRAINSGFTEAYVGMGKLAAAGHMTGTPDREVAHALYQHAAANGSVEGQFLLGHLLMTGYQNLNAAEPWLLQAAQQEYA